MLDAIILFSLRNKLLIGLLVLVLIGVGVYSLRRLPLDALPDITANQVQVLTKAPALSAQDVERAITFPLEQAFATVPGTLEVRSISRAGLSVITIVFEDGADPYWARQQVAERMAEASRSLDPTLAAAPELAPMATGLGEIFQYTLMQKGAANLNPTQLRTLQDWTVRRMLLGTTGLADVSSFGGFLKEYEIAIDPARLQAMGVSVSELLAAASSGNQNAGGAYLERGPNAYLIRSEGMAKSLEEVGQIVIRTSAVGTPLLIRDVADLREGHAVRFGAMTRGADPEAVGGIVLMRKGANSAQVIAAVKARIVEINRALPPGVQVVPYLDRTKLVDHAIRTVWHNLAEGALIVLFVLILILGNWRAGLVVASVIPLSLLFAISMMVWLGISGNLMSLGAIDFGLIVDGSVIVVEAILFQAALAAPQDRATAEAWENQVYAAASDIRRSASFGELIILAVYLPILALTGIEGKMFRPMAQTVGLAILGAFVLSLTYVPALSALTLRRSVGGHGGMSERVVSAICRRYVPVLAACLRRPTAVLAGAAVAVALGVWGFLQLGGEFIPTLDEGDFAVEMRLLPGTNLAFTQQKAMQAARILKARFLEEVVEVVAKIGSSEIPVDPMPFEACDLIVVLREPNRWTRAHNREALATLMSKELEVLAGVTFGFQQPVQMRFNELSSGGRQDVILKIYGDDLTKLQDLARQAGTLLGTVDGLSDLYVEQSSGLPGLRVVPDRAALARYGLRVADVNQAIETGFAGKAAGRIYAGDQYHDLVLRLHPSVARSASSIGSLMLTTPTGQSVPLAQVAAISLEESPGQIQRDAGRRRITVGFNARGRDVESLVEDAHALLNRRLPLPPGYYIHYGGQFQNLAEARERLAVAVPAVLLLIFGMLYATFGSLRQTLIIFLAIPFAVIGGVGALLLRGMPFSISAGVGFIALFGVAVLNGIVLVSRLNQLREEGLPLLERILQGAQDRLRAVLLTATIASVGFLPMALSGSAGAEVQRPLATVVIGGLLTSTLLTLLVLPVLYELVEKRLNTESNSGGAIGKIAILILGMMGTTISISSAQNAPASSTQLMLQQAYQASPQLRADALTAEASTRLKAAAYDLGPTSLLFQYGQYNSPYLDNSFTLNQSFAFPTLYRRQARLAGQEAELARLQLRTNRVHLRQALLEMMQRRLYAYARLRLQDRLLGVLLAQERISTQRLRAGETALLELVTVQSLVGEARLARSVAQADLEAAGIQLQTYLGQPPPPLTSADTLLPVTLTADSLAWQQNPALAQVRAQAEQSRLAASVAGARLLPDVLIGGFSQTLTGTYTVNGQERFYGLSSRFYGVQAGLSFPIFTRPALARRGAARTVYQAALEHGSATEASVSATYNTQRRQALYLSHALSYYADTALGHARYIRSQARQLLLEGAIGYYELAAALQRSTTIELAALEAAYRYNLAVLALEGIAGVE